jgi:predicted phosphodiesterase
MRQCTICREFKDESEFYFALDKGKRRYKSACKVCMREKANNRYKGVKTDNSDLRSRKDKVDIITKFLDACDYNPDNIDHISKDKFRRCFKIEESFDFGKLKQDALTRLDDLGYCHPSELYFNNPSDCGNYLIIGDTFGKKTSTDKFKLLCNIAEVVKARAVIVIGHNTDDYNDVSNAFKHFLCPVYFIPIKNELKDINQYCKQDDNSSIILDKIIIGNTTIRNQEHITPYVKTAISTLDPLIYGDRCITNCTRHEYFQRASTGLPSYIASPGAMAEPHVVRVAYKLTLTNGGRVNVTPAGRDSFMKYRKNDIDKGLWECGCIVLTYKAEGTQCHMVRIQNNMEGKPSCVVSNKYVDSKTSEIIKPEYAVLSDLHAPYFDPEKLQHVKSWLKKVNPYKIIINGDFLDCRSMNPHNPYEAAKADFEHELTMAEALASSLSEYCQELQILFGNHEDFIRRFNEKYPQLAKFIYRSIIDRLSQHASVAILDRNYVFFDGSIYLVHGSNDIYGATGKQIEKIARSVAKDAIMGHTHSPCIRFGVYCSGCLCDYNQGYNNHVTSNWQHGFILVYIYKGRQYIQQIIL